MRSAPGLAALLLLTIAAFAGSPIDGSWDLSYETEAGVVDTTTTFKAEGAKLFLVTPDGQISIGTFKDNRLEFVIPNGLPDVGFSADLVVSAELSGDRITGHYEFLDYAGPVTGVRKR